MMPFPDPWPAAAAHPPRYRWHKYWGRKPHNLIQGLLAHHLTAPGRMLDLFCGSGVAATEALLLGHQAVAADLNPVAIGILTQTACPPGLADLDAAMLRLADRCAGPIDALYASHCRACGSAVTLACMIWKQEAPLGVRYRCEACGHRGIDDTPSGEDRQRATAQGDLPAPDWPLAYPDGQPYAESQGAATVTDLLWPRARHGLALLQAAIAEEPAPLRAALTQVLTAMTHLVSRLCPVATPGPGNHATPFSSFWAQHSFNRPAEAAMEQPVWTKFHASYWGHQGLRKAITDLLAQAGPFRRTTEPAAWLAGRADLLTLTGPALERLQALQEASGGEACLDLLFADPPYGGTIQYGELSSLWNAYMLTEDEATRQRALNADQEVTCNRASGRDLDIYRRDLSAHFAAARPLLKPAAPAIVTFHSPKGALRHAAIGAIVAAGFQLQAIRHNAGARLSAKACQQPFGSVEGDFWLLFVPGRAPALAQDVDWPALVVATARQILGEAAVPLAYTDLINHLDPRLAEAGFFAAETAPVAVDRVLKQALDQDLTLVDGDRFGSKGRLWTVFR
jgi:16S rRNA G966 N2-methylase RsmD